MVAGNIINPVTCYVSVTFRSQISVDNVTLRSEETRQDH